jgi:hypothetical protein
VSYRFKQDWSLVNFYYHGLKGITARSAAQ